MNSPDDKILNEFLKNFPRQEIIDILGNIDGKISSLHTISSKDFLYFNQLLKQYYSSVKEISEANNIISLFFNKDLPAIREEIKEKNNLQIQLLNETDSQISDIIRLLSGIYSLFDLLIVPINNFKQNLITFKYILANLKLHLNYLELGNVKELQKSISLIESRIEEINGQTETLNNETESVSKQIINLRNNPCLGDSIENSELKEELKKVTTSFKKLSFEDYLPENFALALANHTQKCFAYMGEVITNIQYHDIIRQKMEHIQISQNQLIDELREMDGAEHKQDSQLTLIIKIPDITDIQVAQLLYTNKDYQTSIEKITNQLLEVGNEMKMLHDLYNSINENSDKFESTFVNQIVLVDSIFTDFYEKIINNWKIASEKIQNINSQYQNLKNEYNAIFQNEKELRKEVRNFELLLQTGGKNYGQELIGRLNSLFSDLQVNSNSIKTHMNNMTQNINSILNVSTTFKPHSKYNYISNNSINNLSEKSVEIREKTKGYSDLSLNISEEITQSLKKIEYYVFFKNTVEEIVTLLNTINRIVNNDALKNILDDNREYLSHLKDLYTMKSEHDVHSKMVDSGKSINDIINENEDSTYNIDDNDIELF